MNIFPKCVRSHSGLFSSEFNNETFCDFDFIQLVSYFGNGFVTKVGSPVNRVFLLD